MCKIFTLAWGKRVVVVDRLANAKRRIANCKLLPAKVGREENLREEKLLVGRMLVLRHYQLIP